MTIKNFTPHTINVKDSNEEIVAYPSMGIARVSATSEVVGTITIGSGSVPLTKNTYGEVTGLPAPEEGVYYIVSRLVLSALNGSRLDVLVPGTQIRNEEGVVIGCSSFDVQ